MITETTKKYLQNKYRDVPGEELRRMDGEFNAELRILEQALSSNEITHEQSQRMGEIMDTLEYLNQSTSEPFGLGQPNTGESRGFGFNIGASEEEKNRCFGEMLQSVARAALPSGGQIAGKPCGRIDNRLLQSEESRSSGLEASTPSLGGFLIGKELSSEIIMKAHKVSKIWNKVRKIPIGAGKNGLKIPFIDETSRATGSRLGGIQVYRLEEGGTKTASKPKFGLLEWTLKKMIGLCYATDELLEDATALGAIVKDGFAEEFSFRLDDECLNGTGAGQFLGILNSACLVTIAKESGQTAKTLIWENIQKIWAQFWPGGYDNGIWLINQNCWTQLMNMSIPIGTGGVPVWLPANLAKGRPNSTLMGLPVIVAEQCQTLGTKGDIYLADFTQYIAITKGGMQSATSIHVKFTTDETTFRFVLRNDAHPSWNSSLIPYKDATSSKPLSPFLTLATRA